MLLAVIKLLRTTSRECHVLGRYYYYYCNVRVSATAAAGLLFQQTLELFSV